MIALIVGAVAIISRPFSTYVKFVYPNAKFEAIGNPYVTERELSRIIENKDLGTFKDSLNSSKDYNVEGEDIKSIQNSLDDHLLTSINMMKADSSKKMKEFFDTYLEKLDIYLIKNSIKNIVVGKTLDADITGKAFKIYTKALLQKLIDSKKENIPDILKENGFNEEIIKSVSEEKINLIKLDIAFDTFIIEKLRTVKVPYKCEPPKKRFINTLIDITNIRNILRAKQIGYSEEACLDLFIGEGQEIPFWKFKEIAIAESVPQVVSALDGTSYYSALSDTLEDYNKDKSVQALESSLEERFLAIVKNISLKNYVTIGPTLRFLVNKEYEIRNLKAVVKGIGENIPSDIINRLMIKEASA